MLLYFPRGGLFMKRIFTAIFLICSLLAFTGCGGGGMKSKAGHLNLALWWFG